MFVYYETNRDCKGTKYNPSFGQNTGIQKKLVATYTQNAPSRLPRILKNYRPTGRRNQGRPLKRLTVVCNLEWVNKWPHSMLAR
jgi:hypothetical protein